MSFVFVNRRADSELCLRCQCYCALLMALVPNSDTVFPNRCARNVVDGNSSPS